jgi:hypothetical protein
LSVNPSGILARHLADPLAVAAVDDSSVAIVRDHAARYGVAPLLAYRLRNHVLPDDRAWCDRVLVASWQRHNKLLLHLEWLTALLNQEGIRAIALKGPLLAQRYYTPAFLRKPGIDIDLAVDSRDLAHACDVLSRAGYRSLIHIDEALSIDHHVPLVHPSRPPVELHFKLTHKSLGIPVGQFFDRAVPWSLPGGQQTLVLSPADQLLHLILHFAHARFGTLFHLFEIRHVARAESIDVRKQAILSAVEHGYCAVIRMLDVAFRIHWKEPFLPEDVSLPKTWLNWRLGPGLYRDLELWSMPGRDLDLPARLKGRWLDFQLTDTPRDALRTLRLLAATARFDITRTTYWGTVKQLRFVPRTEPDDVSKT